MGGASGNSIRWTHRQVLNISVKPLHTLAFSLVAVEDRALWNKYLDGGDSDPGTNSISFEKT